VRLRACTLGGPHACFVTPAETKRDAILLVPSRCWSIYE
jgi:hypothetical protein